MDNIIKQETNNIINGLKNSDFFKDFKITDFTYAEKHIANILENKVKKGYKIDAEQDDLFTDQEFDDMLFSIVAGSTMNELNLDSNSFFINDEGKITIKQ